jgi:putative ABC transport system permease protein
MKIFWFLIQRFIFRDLLKNRVRTILTVLGIALGVAVMLAINLANQTALAKFQESIDLVSGTTTLQVQPTTAADLDESTLAKLAPLWDEQIKFTPFIDQLAVTASEPHEVIQVIGVDLLADKDFRRMETEKTAPDSSGFDIFRLRQAFVGSELAQRFHLKAGDPFNVLVNDREETLTVRGILGSAGLGKAFSGNVIVMDIGSAQEMFDMKGRIDRIDMIVPEERIADVSSRLRSSLGAGIAVERPKRRGLQVQKMLRSFQYNLTATSLIALLVGMFLIYNTMSISVIRRRLEVGTMKALGLPSSLVFSLFTVEAIILGSIGSALGAGLGIVFAQFAVRAVARTVQALYADQPVSGVLVEPGTIVIAVVVGTILTVVAAIGPALEAVSIAPAEATRRASYERKVQRLAPVLALLGMSLLIVAGIASLQPPIAGFPFFGYLAAACAVFGTASFTPVVLNLLLKTGARPLAKVFGMEARLASLSLHGALGRTSVTVASLMVGISMMVSLAVMIGSFRHTVLTWVEQTLRADLWVEPSTRAASKRAGKLTDELVKKIRSVDGLDAVDAFTDFPIEYEGEPCNLGAGELNVMKSHGHLLFLNGEPSAQVLGRVGDHDAVIVSESFAIKHNKKMRDVLSIDAPKGKFDAKIEGVYYDYASDNGFIIMPKEAFRKHFDDRDATTLAIFLKPGFSPELEKEKIFAALPANSRLIIRTNRELKAEVLRVFDNTFSITYALHAISVAVAILGVMNSLFALTMESRRELGIFKYLGASEKQVRKLVLVQAGILGTLGNCGGLAVGFVLALLLIHVINKQSFGWTVQLDLPLGFLAQSFSLIFVCSLLAGLVPARLAAKTPAPEVVRSE